jgi:hypothetical protein
MFFLRPKLERVEQRLVPLRQGFIERMKVRKLDRNDENSPTLAELPGLMDAIIREYDELISVFKSDNDGIHISRQSREHLQKPISSTVAVNWVEIEKLLGDDKDKAYGLVGGVIRQAIDNFKMASGLTMEVRNMLTSIEHRKCAREQQSYAR